MSEAKAAKPVAVPDYDRVWDEVYGDLQEVGPVHRHMKRLLREILGTVEYRSVLDVGCGFGHNLPLLTGDRDPLRLAGIDISQRAIDHVSNEWNGEFHVLDAAKEQLDDRFDLVFSSLLLEHVPDDVAVLSGMREMCNRDLVVTTIAGDFERHRPWEEQMGHVRNYAPGELEAKLRAAGFEPQEVLYWGFPLYSPLARRLQNRMKSTNEMSPATRALAHLMHAAYFLNSKRRGDLLIAHARAV